VTSVHVYIYSKSNLRRYFRHPMSSISVSRSRISDCENKDLETELQIEMRALNNDTLNWIGCMHVFLYACMSAHMSVHVYMCIHTRMCVQHTDVCARYLNARDLARVETCVLHDSITFSFVRNMNMRPILYVHGLEYTCVWNLVLIEALRNSASEAIVNTKRLRQRPSHFPQLIHTLYPRALKHARQCAALSRV